MLLPAPSDPGGCWMDVRVVYHGSCFEVRSGRIVRALTALRFDDRPARRPPLAPGAAATQHPALLRPTTGPLP
jgi:hypothetical protein